MPSKRELFLDRAIRIPWFREERMRELTVTVVGIGNIGSQLVIALCSLGIGGAYLLDKDIVEYTNLQRQIVYGKEDIGRPKADAAADFVKKRFEDLDIDVRGIA
ncbi:ThiF family adenylyltransferase, partial [Ferroglobus sp.]|uniref:HesA/MoeB/ThiF family protein n=1 Tax=Ferroglobus sp. TaxID=2614230 RepID=UPI0025C45652